MSHTKILVHNVWTTKNRIPYLYKQIRPLVFNHILEYGETKDIHIEAVNGYTDHVHCLISLSRQQNISDCLKLIKGESSFWINKRKLIGVKFQWQDDFWAVSIGLSHLGNLRRYIWNQEAHHRKKTFKQEEDRFLQLYPFLHRLNTE